MTAPLHHLLHNRYVRLAIQIALVLILSLLVMQPAEAFRCGSKIVKKGDLLAKVKHYCGEPTAVQRRSISRGSWVSNTSGDVSGTGSGVSGTAGTIGRSTRTEVFVEEWTYNFGSRKLMRVVTFENGVVTNIDSDSYGF